MILDRKELQDGEELVVEQGAVLAFERSVELDIRKTGGCLAAWPFLTRHTVDARNPAPPWIIETLLIIGQSTKFRPKHLGRF